MKKSTILALLSALLLATALNSCQSTRKNNIDPDQSDDQTLQNGDSDTLETDVFALNTVANDLLENASFPAMYTLTDDDEISLQFGVDAENFVEMYAACADQYPGIERIFLAKYAENADREGVQTALNDYLETLKAEYIDYVPAEYEKAKNVSLCTDGDYVALVIAGDSDNALKIVKQYIK